MKTCDKSHSHSKGPKVPKNVFWFTFFHTGTGYIATYYFSLYYMRNKPEDYPEHYYTFHLWLYNFVWIFCMTNLVLSRFKSPGKSCNTREESDGKCEKCNIYRIDRTHHCSNCKKCIVRMDHHCAWVSNCIGLNNHKNFFWYTFYTAIGGTYHIYLGLMYIFSSYPSAYDSYLARIWFYLHTLIVMLFTYFCITLTNMQVKFIARNNTNLEYMKEIGMNWDFMKCIIWPIVKDI